MNRRTISTLTLLALLALPGSAFAQQVPVSTPTAAGPNSTLQSELQLLMSSYTTLLQGMSNLQKTAQDTVQAIVANMKP